MTVARLLMLMAVIAFLVAVFGVLVPPLTAIAAGLALWAAAGLV